ncbi:hypothetical protein [Sporisorium scitamineum]|uniref:DDE-1 domain-containing protein n=1 Tax=Sporisorium scitamineum TaxID=49012 RepID=A0A0F7RXG7_9BASI|nr:hypothetical protein [Sporisorium scitamineum]
MVNISPHKKVARTQLKADCDAQEQQIQAALLDLSRGSFKTIKAAAECYKLLYKTLHHHKQGRKSHSKAFKGLQALPPEAEDALVQHIHRQADFGFPTVTMIECISAHGPPPLPMDIFKGKSHQQGWYQDHAAAKEWVFATSPNGWTDNDLALEW